MSKTLPKIGIRPMFGSRLGGVRESLKKQTRAMGKNTARLLAQNLCHHTGEEVECVIADNCIGGRAEASVCADTFSRAGVGVSLYL
jgi:L-fucose isomerase